MGRGLIDIQSITGQYYEHQDGEHALRVGRALLVQARQFVAAGLRAHPESEALKKRRDDLRQLSRLSGAQPKA